MPLSKIRAVRDPSDAGIERSKRTMAEPHFPVPKRLEWTQPPKAVERDLASGRC
jgi:hypothetical protein